MNRRATKNSPECDKSCLGIHIGADFTEDEREFLIAMERWMVVNRNRFPTFTQILGVARQLGYRKGASSC